MFVGKGGAVPILSWSSLYDYMYMDIARSYTKYIAWENREC